MFSTNFLFLVTIKFSVSISFQLSFLIPIEFLFFLPVKSLFLVSIKFSFFISFFVSTNPVRSGNPFQRQPRRGLSVVTGSLPFRARPGLDCTNRLSNRHHTRQCPEDDRSFPISILITISTFWEARLFGLLGSFGFSFLFVVVVVVVVVAVVVVFAPYQFFSTVKEKKGQSILVLACMGNGEFTRLIITYSAVWIMSFLLPVFVMKISTW